MARGFPSRLNQRGEIASTLTITGFFLMALGVLVGAQIAAQSGLFSYRGRAAGSDINITGAHFKLSGSYDFTAPQTFTVTISDICRPTDQGDNQEAVLYARAGTGTSYIESIKGTSPSSWSRILGWTDYTGSKPCASGHGEAPTTFTVVMDNQAESEDGDSAWTEQCPDVGLKLRLTRGGTADFTKEIILQEPANSCPGLQPTPTTGLPIRCLISGPTTADPGSTVSLHIVGDASPNDATPRNIITGYRLNCKAGQGNDMCAGEDFYPFIDFFERDVNFTYNTDGNYTARLYISYKNSTQPIACGHIINVGVTPAPTRPPGLTLTPSLTPTPTRPPCPEDQPGYKCVAVGQDTCSGVDVSNQYFCSSEESALGGFCCYTAPTSTPAPTCAAPNSAPIARSAGPGSGAGDPSKKYSDPCYGPHNGSTTWGHFKVRRIQEELDSSQTNNGYFYRYHLKRNGQILKTEDLKHQGGDPNLIFTNVNSSNFCNQNFDWSVSVQKVCANGAVSNEVESPVQNSWIGCCSGSGGGGSQEPPICSNSSLCSQELPNITDFSVTGAGDGDGVVNFTWRQPAGLPDPLIEPAKYNLRWARVDTGGLDNDSSTECCSTIMCGGAEDCGSRTNNCSGNSSSLAGYHLECRNGVCTARRAGIVIKEGGQCVQYEAQLNYENKSGCHPHKQKSSNRIRFSDCGTGAPPQQSHLRVNTTAVNENASTDIAKAVVFSCEPGGGNNNCASDGNASIFGPIPHAPTPNIPTQQSYDHTFVSWLNGPILAGKQYLVGVWFFSDDNEEHGLGYCTKLATAGSPTSITCTLKDDGTVETTQAFTELELADLIPDNRINTLDYRQLADAYYQSGRNLPEDLNQDGQVNALDMSILIKWMGYEVPATPQEVKINPAEIKVKAKPQP